MGRPGHTKVFKNGTSCSSIGTQDLQGRARTGRPTVRIMWLGVVLCHDTSVRQHYKNEHWAPCRNQTPSWYDWKIVESDVKPEQTTTSWVAKHATLHADSKDANQTGQMPRLIWVSAGRTCHILLFVLFGLIYKGVPVFRTFSVP